MNLHTSTTARRPSFSSQPLQSAPSTPVASPDQGRGEERPVSPSVSPSVSPAIRCDPQARVFELGQHGRARQAEIEDLLEMKNGYLGQAQATNTRVRAWLTKGSNAVHDRKLSNQQAFELNEVIEKAVSQRIDQALHDGTIRGTPYRNSAGKRAFALPAPDVARIRAAVLRETGFGTCSDVSAAAYRDLVDRLPAGTRVEQCRLVGGDHSLVVIGRREGSDPKDMSTWGPEAVVCDAWANKAYPLSQFEAMRRPELDVKRFNGSSDAHYLSGRLQVVEAIEALVD